MKLNIGGQHNITEFSGCGWVCVDMEPGSDYVVKIDEDPLPFSDGSVDAIYASHVIEHIFSDKLPYVLNEFKRVLCPGGKLRIVVPDMDIVINAYINKDYEFLKYYDVTARGMEGGGVFPHDSLYHMISWFFTYYMEGEKRVFSHVNGFTKQSIRLYLESVGFKNIIDMEYGISTDIFNSCDFEGHKICSLYIEATN